MRRNGDNDTAITSRMREIPKVLKHHTPKELRVATPGIIYAEEDA